MDKSRQKSRFLALIIAVCLVASNHIAAQIITDGSTGAQLTLTGQDVTIEETLGTRAGSNLFHSFSTFNISSGGSATFTGDAGIQNVISRVTGGDVSNLQGTLRSEVGNANFYFINPAGVTFGEGGAVDVPASFHVSTNNELRFTDGTVLDTASPTTSALSISAPQAFGFLSEGAGAIEVNGAEIEVINGNLGVTSNELSINSGTLASSGDINIEVSDDVVIQNGGRVISQTFSGRNAGDVTLTAGQLFVDSGEAGNDTPFETGLFSLSEATGDAGNISILVEDLVTLQNVGSISTDTSAEGDAGNIQLTANQLLIDGRDREFSTGISSSAVSDSTGNAGTIEISISGQVTIQGSGGLNTSTFAQGDAGNIQLTAGELLIDGRDNGLFTGISSSAFGGSTGNAGTVDISINGSVTLLRGSIIFTGTSSEGDGGNIQLTADQLLIDGGTGGLFTGISSSAPSGTGNAGTIDITISGLVTIQNGSGILSSIGTGQGDAGSILVTANEMLIDGQGGVSLIASSTNPGSTGSAGTVVILVKEQLTVQNGAGITALSAGEGDAGFVTITSNNGTIRIIHNAGIVSSATGDSSDAGDITVSTGGSVIIEDSFVGTESTGGEAGPVNISAGILETSNSVISTTAFSPVADGGNVSIETEVFILEETFILANAVSGSGGTITIDSDAVVAFANQLNLQSVEGLELTPDDPGIVIQSVAEDGVILPSINAPERDISAAVTELNANPGDAPTVASDPCAGFIEGAPSSLVESGRGGLPVTDTTLTELPTVAAQVTFTEHQIPIAMKDAETGSLAGCRS